MLSYWSKRNRVNGRLIATACEVGLSSSGICGFPHDDNPVSQDLAGPFQKSTLDPMAYEDSAWRGEEK